MPHHRLFIVSASASCILSASAFAGDKEAHFDIWLQPIGSRIVTGSITEGSPGNPVSAIERIFGAELGEDDAFPHSATEPGIQALAGPLTAGMTWSFNIVQSLGAWNGAGFDPAAETMTIGFGPASATTASGFVPGFNFTGEPTGLLHDHFDFTLNAASPLSGGAPGDGVYLLALEFLSVNGSTSYAASDPVFIVFNLGMDEEMHESAIEWTQQNLVPAPAPLALLALAIGIAPRRRRRA